MDLEAKAQDLKRAIELEKLSHVRLERDQVLFWLDRFRGGSLQSQEFRRKVIDAFVSVVYLERARVFGTVIFGQYRILSPLFLLLI